MQPNTKTQYRQTRKSALLVAGLSVAAVIVTSGVLLAVGARSDSGVAVLPFAALWLYVLVPVAGLVAVGGLLTALFYTILLHRPSAVVSSRSSTRAKLAAPAWAQTVVPWQMYVLAGVVLILMFLIPSDQDVLHPSSVWGRLTIPIDALLGMGGWLLPVGAGIAGAFSEKTTKQRLLALALLAAGVGAYLIRLQA